MLSVYEMLGEHYLCDQLHMKFWSAHLVETLLTHEATGDEEEPKKKQKQKNQQQPWLTIIIKSKEGSKIYFILYYIHFFK